MQEFVLKPCMIMCFRYCAPCGIDTRRESLSQHKDANVPSAATCLSSSNVSTQCAHSVFQLFFRADTARVMAEIEISIALIALYSSVQITSLLSLGAVQLSQLDLQGYDMNSVSFRRSLCMRRRAVSTTTLCAY